VEGLGKDQVPARAVRAFRVRLGPHSDEERGLLQQLAPLAGQAVAGPEEHEESVRMCRHSARMGQVYVVQSAECQHSRQALALVGRARTLSRRCSLSLRFGTCGAASSGLCRLPVRHLGDCLRSLVSGRRFASVRRLLSVILFKHTHPPLAERAHPEPHPAGRETAARHDIPCRQPLGPRQYHRSAAGQLGVGVACPAMQRVLLCGREAALDRRAAAAQRGQAALEFGARFRCQVVSFCQLLRNARQVSLRAVARQLDLQLIVERGPPAYGCTHRVQAELRHAAPTAGRRFNHIRADAVLLEVEERLQWGVAGQAQGKVTRRAGGPGVDVQGHAGQAHLLLVAVVDGALCAPQAFERHHNIGARSSQATGIARVEQPGIRGIDVLVGDIDCAGGDEREARQLAHAEEVTVDLPVGNGKFGFDFHALPL